MNAKYITENEIFPQIQQPLWHNWYIKENIGSGSCSSVYRMEKPDNYGAEISALKVKITMADGQFFKTPEEKIRFLQLQQQKVQNEISIMKYLNTSPYVVAYGEVSEHELYINNNFEGYYSLIRMEFLNNISEMMHSGNFNYSESNIRKLAFEIGNGIKAVHDAGIIHKSIKPENLFISQNGTYKLGDFNLSKQAFSPDYYTAPEVYYSAENSTTQADIYSFGLCLYQMMNNGLLPFEEFCDPETARNNRMQGMPINPPQFASPEFANIILKACSFDISSRYHSIDEMLNDLTTPKITENYSVQNDKSSSAKTVFLVAVIVFLLVVAGVMIFIFLKSHRENVTESSSSFVFSETENENIITEPETTEEPETIEETEEPETIEETEEPETIEETEEPETIEETQPPAPESKKIFSTADAIRSVVCSSQLEDIVSYGVIHNYSPWNLFDNNVNTCWCEGVSGKGEGEEIYIELNDTYSVDNIRIYNGLQESMELFYKNARARELYFEFSNGETFVYELSGEWENSINDIPLPHTIETNYIKIEIYSTYSGNKYDDTCISEIMIQ